VRRIQSERRASGEMVHAELTPNIAKVPELLRGKADGP
jgi:hypothetical protein